MPRAIPHKLTAGQDIVFAIQNIQLAFLLGWQDIAQRYRRSSIGAFWLTINMGVLIGALGLIFGTLFGSPMSEFLPFICLGLIFWGYFSSIANDGCNAFIARTDTILQLPIPFFTHIIRNWWSATIILAHNLVIFPVVMLSVGRTMNWNALLVAPGFILVSINLLWISLFLAILCTRYRDLTQIIQNFMQVMMYVTPVMWLPSTIEGKASPLMLDLNPFYHLLSVVRDPLLGAAPTSLNWIVSIAFAVIGWCITILFLSRYKARIAYWL